MNKPASRASASSASPAPSGPRRKSPANGKPARRGGKSSTLGKKTSPEANRRAAVILEVLAGERLPSEAAQALGVSVTHYYLLERKALEALLASCQPQPKGRTAPSAEKQLARLERQLEKCRRECQRQAALVRATQRAVGLPLAASSTTTGKQPRRNKKEGSSTAKRPRRRRPTVRALRAAETLEKNSSLPNHPDRLEQPVDDKSDAAGEAPTDRSGGTGR